MPNVSPQDLPISIPVRTGPWGPVCPQGTCVDAKRSDAGVHVTSTIDGNDGAVTFTHAEWDGFIGQVKRGDWDHTVS